MTLDRVYILVYTLVRSISDVSTSVNSFQGVSLIQVAQGWLDQGVAVIPIKPQSKVAAIAWDRYQAELPTTDKLAQWFGPFNLGVVCGWQGLTVLDFDQGLAPYIRWQVKTKALAQTYTVRTARGFHVYLWCQKPPDRNLKMTYGDVKAHGYVLGAGSIHPTGVRYQEIKTGPVLTVGSIEEALPEGFRGDGVLRTQPSIRENVPAIVAVNNIPSLYARHVLRSRTVSHVTVIKESFLLLSKVIEYGINMEENTDPRYYLGKCPFHPDNNPSFWVDTLTNRCGCQTHCFPGKPLDVIGFYAKIEHISEAEAIKILYKKAIS